MTTSSADLPQVRKRLLYRAWHRGMKELDILLGSFADRNLATMSDAEAEQLATLMDAPEPLLFDWLMGKSAPPESFDTPLLAKIIAFHKTGGAVLELENDKASA